VLVFTASNRPYGPAPVVWQGRWVTARPMPIWLSKHAAINTDATLPGNAQTADVTGILGPLVKMGTVKRRRFCNPPGRIVAAPSSDRHSDTRIGVGRYIVKSRGTARLLVDARCGPDLSCRSPPYLLVSTSARCRSSDSTSAGSATVSAISRRNSSRYLFRSL
jgi:hypothetical protein